MAKERDSVYISHILEEIRKIELFLLGVDRDEFVVYQPNDQEILSCQYAVFRSLEIIGEASKNISRETKNLLKDIPWGEIVGMRNKIIHEYDVVNYHIVWDTAIHGIPILKKELEKLKLSA